MTCNHASVRITVRILQMKHLGMLNYSFWIVFYIHFVLNHDCVFASTSIPSSFMDLKSDIGDRLFARPKFTTVARGRIECGMKCLQYACCFTITFNPITRQCAGYTATFKPTDSYTADAGSVTYELQGQGLLGPDLYVYNSSIDLCFSLKTIPRTQMEAIEYCKLGGGYLMPIETLEKMSAVWQGVISSVQTGSLMPDPSLWVDGFNAGSGQFVLENGDFIPSNSLLWAIGEPSNSGGQDCVVLNELFLYDDDCLESHKYICEYE